MGGQTGYRTVRPLIPKTTQPMKFRITFLSCILMSLCFAIKAQAREEVADSHIESLVALADSCKQQNNLYRALTIYEEAYKYEASADVLPRRALMVGR